MSGPAFQTTLSWRTPSSGEPSDEQSEDLLLCWVSPEGPEVVRGLYAGNGLWAIHIGGGDFHECRGAPHFWAHIEMPATLTAAGRA